MTRDKFARRTTELARPDRKPFFYDQLREDGFVEDLPWNLATQETRRRCLRLKDYLDENDESDAYARGRADGYSEASGGES